MKRLIDEDSDIRLDVYLTEELGISRSQIKKLFNLNQVLVNESIVKPSYKLKEGDFLSVDQTLESFNLEAVNLEVETIYEDDAIIVINKPRGLLIHPSVSNKRISLVNHLLFISKDLSNIGGIERPGIVHRLDQDTSGLLVVAKTNEAHIHLVNQFKDRRVKKLYEAIVHQPFIEDKGTIEAPIMRDESHIKMAVSPYGKAAITHFNILNQNDMYAHLNISIITGRTHQIRVHLSYIDHPIVGDVLYGPKKRIIEGQVLHARVLGFYHPITNTYMEFNSPLPDYFKAMLKKLDL